MLEKNEKWQVSEISSESQSASLYAPQVGVASQLSLGTAPDWLRAKRHLARERSRNNLRKGHTLAGKSIGGV